ncbi:MULTISPECIES: YdbL family protein [unclassified Photobacterium]|uniref:YdbL family protein n=1 Tax=unclassified Photobacterium TaxID=2628852 RepID=UPI001EE0BC17|nr:MULTISPECIES: YdbL family protein [unclassified Photobacterium]MCG3865239.1 YdbL family protein [Photobacterium sp. Ph6]MCG3876728.1 YdbL family protein [Photobacterium sp. Ph5]
MTKIYFKFVLSVLTGLLLLSSVAHALTLQQAKQQGLIGEANNGYVASVQPTPSPSLMALINSVNNKRQQGYLQISKKNNLSLDEVSSMAQKKAVKKTLPGHYFQTKTGAWVKK